MPTAARPRSTVHDLDYREWDVLYRMTRGNLDHVNRRVAMMEQDGIDRGRVYSDLRRRQARLADMVPKLARNAAAARTGNGDR